MDENIASILEGKYTPFISTCFVFRCRGCKYGQVLSCSSSPQIPRAYDSQACCLYGDLNMGLHYICFFDDIVGAAWDSKCF